MIHFTKFKGFNSNVVFASIHNGCVTLLLTFSTCIAFTSLPFNKGGELGRASWASWAKWGNKRARNAVSGRYGQHEKWATRETGNTAQLQSAAPETWTPAGWTPLYIDKLYKRLESLVSKSNAIFLPCVGLVGGDLTLTLVLWLESNHLTMQFA